MFAFHAGDSELTKSTIMPGLSIIERKLHPKYGRWPATWASAKASAFGCMKEKIRAVCAHLSSEADLLRVEERRLAARRKSRERAVERVRGYAAGILSSRRVAGLEPKIKTTAGTYWLATTKSLEGPPGASAWEEAGLAKVEVKPDRTAARKALEGGAVIDGFALVEKESIRWR